MVIEKYNINWKNQFSQIKNVLEKYLSVYTVIEHVGSTASTGMWAKPIIDIIIVIDSKNDFNKIKDDLENIGYYHNGDQGITGREVFKRNKKSLNDVLDNISHHLYVCEKDNLEYRRNKLFWNYLNIHENSKMEYNKIKHEILERVGKDNRRDYVYVKETEYKWFFEEIIKKAEEEEEIKIIEKRHNCT